LLHKNRIYTTLKKVYPWKFGLGIWYKLQKAPLAPFEVLSVVDIVRKVLLTASKNHYLYSSENQLDIVKYTV
jgi:hypothetical protein